MSHFELHAHLKIRPGQLEGFKAQAAELIRITPGTGHQDASLRLVHQKKMARSARSMRRT